MEAADRTAPPVRGDGVALDAIEGKDPAPVETALVGEIGGHGRQQRVEVGGGRLREGDGRNRSRIGDGSGSSALAAAT